MRGPCSLLCSSLLALCLSLVTKLQLRSDTNPAVGLRMLFVTALRVHVSAMCRQPLFFNAHKLKVALADIVGKHLVTFSCSLMTQ